MTTDRAASSPPALAELRVCDVTTDPTVASARGLWPRVPFSGPPMNVRPVPGGSAADRPAGLEQHTALPPLIDGDTSDTEAVGDLSQTHGLAVVHDSHCIESLDGVLVRTDNQYMTEERLTYGDVTIWLRQHHHVHVSGTVTWTWACRCGKAGNPTTRGRAVAGRDRHLQAQRRAYLAAQR